MYSADRHLLDSLTVRSTQPITATSSSAMNALVPSSTALGVTSSAATSGKFINYYFLICVCIICVKVLFLICLCLSYRLQINCNFI
ncbi:uncharacterized protein LOC136094079 isoform X4 [Hydra vulgaris]|uniref:uncharacterized protein LOC136094079 isoform X4 n=1 Tax=Hydra vulgaris TaxID=6087 RepID=UPI0032EA4583